MCDSPYKNSPASSVATLISFGTSVYSITFTFPFFLHNTPTLSFGLFLITVLVAILTFCFIAKPSKSVSTYFTSRLSTEPIKIHFMFLDFISSIIPFLAIE